MPRSIKELMKDHCKIEEDRIEMLESLLKAVEGAGGCYQRFFEGVVEEDMTVAELIDTLAQNNIRFVYLGDKK